MRCLSDDARALADNTCLTELERVTVMNIEDEVTLLKLLQEIPLIGKVLRCLANGILDPKSFYYDITWTAADTQAAKPDETIKLISDLLGEDVATPFAMVQFAQVLGYLLNRTESWTYLDVRLNFRLLQFQSLPLNFYRMFVEMARIAATEPLKLSAPPFVVGVLHGKGGIAGVEIGRLKGHMDDALVLSFWEAVKGTNIVDSCNDLDARRDIYKVLKHMTDGEHPVRSEPSGELSLTMVPFCALMNIHMRLMSNLCPVVLLGRLNNIEITALAESMQLQLKVLEFSQDISHRLHTILDASSDINDTNLTYTGTLFVISRAPLDSLLQLGQICRRLKEFATPYAVRFLISSDAEEQLEPSRWTNYCPSSWSLKSCL